MHSTTYQQGESTSPGLRRLDRWLAQVKSHQRTILLAGVGFQVIVLVAMMVKPLTTRITGDTILLRVVPVDPRDLFRGDYVILSYEMSRLPPQGGSGIPSNVPTSSGDSPARTVYVTLMPDKDGQHWSPGEFRVDRPSGGKFIRGRLKGWNRVEFGIESFFVQEGMGLEYEHAVRNGKLSAEVAVDRDGNAVLKRLVIE